MSHKTHSQDDDSLSGKFFEIVDFTSRNGQTVSCAKRRSALIAFGKIEIYAMGKVRKHDQEKLISLQRMKQTKRKMYDANPKNEATLRKLKILRHNYERSQEMWKSVQKVEMTDSRQDINKIIDHLLDIGNQVTQKTRKDYPSQMKAPKGLLRILSTWAILSDGTKYLSTLKLIPKEST